MTHFYLTMTSVRWIIRQKIAKSGLTHRQKKGAVSNTLWGMFSLPRLICIVSDRKEIDNSKLCSNAKDNAQSGLYPFEHEREALGWIQHSCTLPWANEQGWELFISSYFVLQILTKIHQSSGLYLQVGNFADRKYCLHVNKISKRIVNRFKN